MDISKLADYIPDYILDQNNLLFLLVVLGFLGYKLDLPAYFQKRKHIRNIRKIIHDGVCKIRADYPTEDPNTGKPEREVRYDHFKAMRSDLKAVLDNPSANLPQEIRTAIQHIYSEVDRIIGFERKYGRGATKHVYEIFLVKPMRKWKWLKLNVNCSLKH